MESIEERESENVQASNDTDKNNEINKKKFIPIITVLVVLFFCFIVLVGVIATISFKLF